ncbi:MAG: cytochrome c biogenesis protein ResB [Nocardioides sp.]|uniref:cytochrome c biogenesis protein ResB n=1 Tax=Nocardioides sp. TaxID=35761 RepID=UPI003F025330
MSDRQATPLPGELTAREFLRWCWRQLTSMRTALLLLLLLALGAIPGSIVPQDNIDSVAVSQWKDEHPKLTPVWEKLHLFSVYDSPWFSAIYLLLMVSLVGCILPRLAVYWRALRARPPKAPRNLSRLPESSSFTTDASVEEVVANARKVLRKRRFRVETDDESVSGERGYLREAGNLLFHLSLLIVLVGFAIGSLYGYKGGAIIVVDQENGGGFANDVRSYDEFKPGSLFDPAVMEPFSFTIDDFDVKWLLGGPRSGMAQKFVSSLTYTTEPGGEEKKYDLKVNHPLSIGGTDVFLIGHGYAPVIEIRDGNGDIAYTGPTPFLPTDGTFRSFGVVKAADAKPKQIGLSGELYPTFRMTDAGPTSEFGAPGDPLISMVVYTGDLGLDDGSPQSVYTLDTESATPVESEDGSQQFRVDLRPGEKAELPDGLGTVEFKSLQRWNKLQISRTPGKFIALTGVVLALIGLCGSLFIRPRRTWVRARSKDGMTVVEVGSLDRSSGGDPERGAAELASIVEALGGPAAGTDSAAAEEESS